MSVIEDAIQKYSKGDEAYKNKLKQGIRDSMGYSNYVSQLNKEIDKPASLGSLKGLSPAGIKSKISSKFNMQKETANTLSGVAGAIDTTAGALAAEQVAREKAAAAKAKALKENLQYTPTNWVESEVTNYLKNPFGEDGKIKTKDQLREQLMGQLVGEGSAGGITEQYINQKINSWIPEDFEKKGDYYQYRAMGYTNAQAEDLQNFDRYSKGQMSQKEKDTYDIMNPTWSAKADQMKISETLIPEIQETETLDGETKPKYLYNDLLNKYPNTDPKIIAEYAKPAQIKFIEDDITKNLNTDEIQQKIEENSLTINDYADFMSGEDYTNFKKAIIPMYHNLFSAQEIDIIIQRMIMSRQ